MAVNYQIDTIKLNHWLNIRKLTNEKFVQDCELDQTAFDRTSATSCVDLDRETFEKVCDYLSVKKEQLAYSKSDYDELGFIYQSKQQLYKTKRLIKRDGCDFYNYYTLPSPEGHVAPVILDILCPTDKLPKLNNGHFEAAITINLGPGPINGRWGEEINDLNFSVLESNFDEDTDWITGASYFEPSYCPHTYSLASEIPAKILSYTVANGLDDFLNEVNGFSKEQQKNYQKSMEKPFVERIVTNQMSLLGYDIVALAERLNIDVKLIESFTKGDFRNISTDLIKNICSAINIDYRSLLVPEITGDLLGKTILKTSESLKTKRTYKKIKWASVASSVNCPDLTGNFMRVENHCERGDLQDNDFMHFAKNSHYLCTSGELEFLAKDSSGEMNVVKILEEDSLWVKPYQSHTFIGSGNLVKMSNGEGVEYTNDFLLGNLFSEQATMKRAYDDQLDWGYD